MPEPVLHRVRIVSVLALKVFDAIPGWTAAHVVQEERAAVAAAGA